MTDTGEQIDQLRLELRRGVVVLAVLSQMDTACYGYSLIQRLSERGLDIEEGTLYPLLRRLEKKVITRAASERIAHTAFQLARTAGRKKVTIVHKSNVMPQTDGLFRRVAFEVAAQYGEIEADELLVDTAAYWMVKDPLRFDVIVTPNLYGDILSDMAAAWGGGLGLAPALNMGAEIAIAEPVHGSAPDIAGKGVANPTATFLSVAMLARYHWNQSAAADRIERAVYQTLNDQIYTGDIRPDGAVGTAEFTRAVIERL